MYWQGQAAAAVLPELDVDPPLRQRRVTVCFRWLLLIPQFILLWFLGIGAGVVAIIGWFGALFMGQLPAFAWTYLAFYLGYAMRVLGYLHLMVDRYPPFGEAAPDYPVRVDLPPPGRLNRLAVLFRFFLALPVGIAAAVLQAGWGACAFFTWLIVLVLGRMPDALFRSTAAVQRFALRTAAYWYMLTSQYPARMFGDGDITATALAAQPGAAPLAGPPPTTEYSAETPRSATRPLLMTGAARGLLLLFIVLGVISCVSDIAYNVNNSDNHNHGVNVYVNTP